MSECFNLVCDDCHVKLWIGEEINERLRETKLMLYRSASEDPVANFLYKHIEHRLRCVGYGISDDDPCWEYTRLDDED